MLIAMAGLPGTGKSTLAGRLRSELGAVVLNKDAVRAVLFPAPVLDYSAAQDDVCMAAIYSAAAAILKAKPRQTVILDGRTFLRSYQMRDLFALAASLNEIPHIVECVCDNEVARERLEGDQALGTHPAGNRGYALYLERKAAAEPITNSRLVLETGKTPLDECVKRSLEYIKARERAHKPPLVGSPSLAFQQELPRDHALALVGQTDVDLARQFETLALAEFQLHGVLREHLHFRHFLPLRRAAELRQIMPGIGCFPETVNVLPSRSASDFMKPIWRVR